MSGPVRPNYDRAESVMAEEEAAVAVLLNSVEMGEYVDAKSVTPCRQQVMMNAWVLCHQRF